MAAPLTPAEMHAFTEFLGMVPMIVIGFIVLVVVLIKTAPRGRYFERGGDYDRNVADRLEEDRIFRFNNESFD